MPSTYIKNLNGIWFGVVFEDETIHATSFASDEKRLLRNLKESLSSDIPIEPLKETSKFGEDVISAVKKVYDGKDDSNDFSLRNKRLSTYARRVISVVRRIPPGYVASYGGVARTAGGSPRAVGRVMASNPFAPLCPCHRVVSSDFTLGGYGGGLSVKRQFLKRERRGYPSKTEVATDSGKLTLFPVEFVLHRLEKDKS
jgi:methylated-DNA-[protein]-cysteine S-methyltransferase